MKLDEIPKEKPRVDLAALPETAVLHYVREEYREGQQGKTGGLVIWWETETGEQFPQKYSKIHGEALENGLKACGVTDTQALANYWIKAKKMSFRSGFPRMIPVGVVRKYEEEKSVKKKK
jgi:hypothetical protein